jgi:hypothetical protein
MGQGGEVAGPQMLSEGTAAGRPRSALDMVVTAIAEVNECVLVTDLVTDNEKHFSGVSVVNPLHPARGKGLTPGSRCLVRLLAREVGNQHHVRARP